jgi:hypothetical protein
VHRMETMSGLLTAEELVKGFGRGRRVYSMLDRIWEVADRDPLNPT